MDPAISKIRPLKTILRIVIVFTMPNGGASVPVVQSLVPLEFLSSSERLTAKIVLYMFY